MMILDAWPPEVAKTDFCCLTLPSLVHFVTAAVRNEHSLAALCPLDTVYSAT